MRVIHRAHGSEERGKRRRVRVTVAGSLPGQFRAVASAAAWTGREAWPVRGPCKLARSRSSSRFICKLRSAGWDESSHRAAQSRRDQKSPQFL